MSTSLRHNLTSAYLDAARKLSPKRARRRIVAYVESYDDIAFWRTLLSEFENEERYFQVMLPSATSLAKGKKMVLMNTLNTSELGRSLIACVDSDYDFLLQLRWWDWPAEKIFAHLDDLTSGDLQRIRAIS